MKARLIAIDGPVAAGKSSVGSLLARRLGYSFFDTGIMYRAFTWKALESGIPPEDGNKLCQLASTTKFDFVPCQEGCLLPLIDGEDVSAKLFYPRVEEQVSLVSRVAGVRKVMVSEQRRLAQRGRIVMAGRDIGTVVLPWAGLKIFLIASVEERAQRRYMELIQQGSKLTYDLILAELKKRDGIDTQRAVSPLKPATDAITIDTDKITLEQVVDTIYNLAVKQ